MHQKPLPSGGRRITDFLQRDERLIQQIRVFVLPLQRRQQIWCGRSPAQDPDRVTALRELARERGLAFFEISSATGQGIEQLKFGMAERVLLPAANV